MAMHPDIKQASESDIRAIFPPGFDFEAFKALKLISRYGWKIVEIDGEKLISAATEEDYNDSMTKMYGDAKAAPRFSCQSYGAGGCSGASCCRLWINTRDNRWYCTC